MRTFIGLLILIPLLFGLASFVILKRCDLDFCLDAQMRVEDFLEEVNFDKILERFKKKTKFISNFQAEDTIVLKNGSKIQGIIQEDRSTPEETFIEIDGGIVSFTKNEIADIRRGEASIEHESGIDTGYVAEADLPYPRLYLKNGNIVHGDEISREEDSFYLKQLVEGGGKVSYGFKFEEIERMLLWPPSDEKLPAHFRRLQRDNFKLTADHPPYAIVSSVESSDSVLYFRALKRLYNDALIFFFDFIDLENPHGQFPVVLFGNYDNFLSYAGLPPGTDVQGFYVPSNKTLYLFNVKQVDLVNFQLKGAEWAKGQIGDAMTHIQNTDYGANSGKWAAYDFLEKVSHEIEKEEMNLQFMARQMTIHTVRHEAIHQFMDYLGFGGEKKYSGAWFSEGLAMYLEPENEGEINKERLYFLRYEKDKGLDLMPLQYLMSFRGGADIHKIAANYSLSAYANSWSIVYFLMKNYRDGFFAYMKELRDQPKGFDSDADIALLEKHIGKTLAEITVEYEPFVEKLMKTEVNEEEYFEFRFFQMHAHEMQSK